MDQPSVSIVVPVYNVGPYVEDCIRSVMRQTYTSPMECIIVDDCGTDDSMQIVERLVTEYDGPITFQILHHTHNRGLSAARNTGMDAATGDYLFFLDSDDELTVDCIEQLTKPLVIEWYDVVTGNVHVTDPETNRQRERQAFLELKISGDLLYREQSALSSFGETWKWSVWNKLYRASLIHDNSLRFKEGLLYEDILWGFIIACKATSFYLLNAVTYLYRYREGSITVPYDRKKQIDAQITIVQEMGDFVHQNKINESLVFPIINSLFRQIQEYYSNSLSVFVSIYKQVRPHIRIKKRVILRANQTHLKKHIHDLHYLLPPFIAPYYQFILSRNHRRKKNKFQQWVH